MAPNDYFLEKDETQGTYWFRPTVDNDVTVFDDNKLYFASILKDLGTATSPDHFIYFAGWWTDIDIPLGDPKAQPSPPTLRETLSALAKGKPKEPGPMTPTGQQENNFGPEVCCMEWQQKGQIDWNLLNGIPIQIVPLVALLPDSLFGARILSQINTDSTQFVNYLRGTNKGILDKATRLFGSHHQKFVVIGNESGLVAYVGSSDFNADRLYQTGDHSAVHPPPDAGAPLNDVNIRVVGPAAADLLTTFIDRWSAHEDGKNWKLKGASYAPSSRATAGGVTMQVTHTYGAGYPFSNTVRSAADAQLKLVRTATQYVYYEDQYLIGGPEIAQALEAKLQENKEFVVIGVMAPTIIVGDLKWINERRSDFWRPLNDKFGATENNRVLLFEMRNDDGKDNGPGAYLHNKMTIVDDEAATVGSVNFSRRSWTHDSEVMVIFGGIGGNVPITASGNDNIVRKVRLMRWARHLNKPLELIDRWPDALAVWRNPQSNRIKAWSPSLNLLDPITEPVYEKVYSVVLDPA